MKIQIGFGEGWAGETIKYRIIDQTVSGRYLVMPYRKLTRSDGTNFLASFELEIKDELDDISEEDFRELDRLDNKGVE